jgi:hypothetical protein
MSRIITSSLIVVFLGLTGCASQQDQSGLSGYITNPDATLNFISVNSANDPDGDGDTKGSNHFPMHRTATGHRVFIFDPGYGAWALYDKNGDRLNTGRASGGKDYCDDLGRGCKTISGTFHIVAKDGPDCISKKFPIETNGGAPMPYCMYFSSKGYAVHGSYDVPDHNASHGCVRVTPTAAKWLSENYMTIGTTVIVKPY